MRKNADKKRNVEPFARHLIDALFSASAECLNAKRSIILAIRRNLVILHMYATGIAWIF